MVSGIACTAKLTHPMSADILLQLNPALPVVTPLGNAQAFFLWTSCEVTMFGVFQDETGENWWFENHLVKLQPNITRGHPNVTRPPLPIGMEEHAKRHKL